MKQKLKRIGVSFPPKPTKSNRRRTLTKMARKHKQKSKASFPPEIIREILLKVSTVKSLLRCKAVCKEWYSLISDQHFIKSHYMLSSTNNINYEHHRVIINTSEYDILSRNPDEQRSNLVSCPLYDVVFDESVVNNAIHLENPLQRPWPPLVRFAGSCNGLLCLRVEYEYEYDDGHIFIYNPSTRIWNDLSARWRKSRHEWGSWYSLGYDESTDDYKLVELFNPKKVNIYSLKTGKWKRLADFPYQYPFGGRGKFSNGALHWVSYELPFSYMWRIVSLDLAKETYGEVLQPQYDEGDKTLTVGVLGESLCVLCDYDMSHTDLWVMKVYGVKNSWTKLASFPYCVWIGKYLDPLFISNDGKVLFNGASGLVICKSKDTSYKKFDRCYEACVVVESLVSPFPPLALADDNNEN